MTTISGWIIGGVIVSMIIAGLVTVTSSFGSAYNFVTPPQLNGTYNKLNDINDRVGNMTTTFRGSDLGTAIGFLPKGIMTTAFLFFDFFDLARSFLAQAVSDLGLEPWVLIGMSAIVIVLMSFLVLSLVARWYT